MPWRRAAGTGCVWVNWCDSWAGVEEFLRKEIGGKHETNGPGGEWAYFWIPKNVVYWFMELGNLCIILEQQEAAAYEQVNQMD